MGLGTIFTKKCAQSYVSSLWRLTWVFDGTWKNFHKNVCPVTHFLRSADYLKFLRGLGKFRQKGVTSYTLFFAVQTILSFGWDLKKFWQKGVTSYTFFRSACNLKFWIGLRKVSTKMCAQLHVFAVQTILGLRKVFGWDLEKFWQKGVTSYTFFRSACYLKFWIGLRKVSTKMCAQLHIFSLWRLTWVFDGTWKISHKNVCPVTHFFRSADYLKFLMWLGKFRQKSVTSYITFFRCGD